MLGKEEANVSSQYGVYASKRHKNTALLWVGFSVDHKDEKIKMLKILYEKVHKTSITNQRSFYQV